MHGTRRGRSREKIFQSMEEIGKKKGSSTGEALGSDNTEKRRISNQVFAFVYKTQNRDGVDEITKV